MWSYQKPGFEALLLAELQKQQQCSQFCDTLLKTDGVSVPAHSCVLSAISPHISSALSSTPPPPAGQTRQNFDFRPFGACTLFRMVSLLYSGEMAGEGEKEKQEAISAAAKLGIHGLVEVTRRDHKSRREEGERQCAEVGVQTEPLVLEEGEGRSGRWRREVRDGSTFLWRETLSGKKDTWTQTEELQVNTAPPSQPAASFECVDMAALQSFGQTDLNPLPPQFPYLPVSLIYAENQTDLPSSALEESTSTGYTSIAVVAPPPAFIPPCLQSAAGDVAVAKEWKEPNFEQFRGNIPGYINYFLNTDQEKSSGRGRPRGSRRARVSAARRAGTGERGARGPPARTGRRGRGGLTQKVDVQDVGVSKLQKLFLQRWGMRASRPGQGGGAAGRKLCLKHRELLESAKGCPRRRVRNKVWDLGTDGELLLHGEGGAGNTQRGRRNSTKQVPVKPQCAKPTTSLSLSSPPLQFYNVHTVSTARPSLQPSPSPSASYIPPASSLLHTTCLPLSAPPPQEDQPGPIDHLLDEAIMGLVSSESRGAGGLSSANGEAPVVQQQEETELNAILEHFFLSFEQHVDSCTAREEGDTSGQGCSKAPVGSSQISKQQQDNEAGPPAHCAAPPEHTQRKKTRNGTYTLPLEKKRVKVRKPALSSDTQSKIVHERADKQLQLIPVVKLERSVALLRRSSVTLEAKGPSSVIRTCDHPVAPTQKKQPAWRSMKTYPTRSRFREAHVDSKLCLVNPLGTDTRHRRTPSARQPGRGRPRKNGQLLSLPNGESPTPPTQPQSAEPCDSQGGGEKSQDRQEEVLTVQPQETGTGRKRGVEVEEGTSDDVTVAKRVCFEQMPQQTSERCPPSAEPAATETEDTIDVETASRSRATSCLQSVEQEENPAWRDTEDHVTAEEEPESSGGKIADVDGDTEDAGRDQRESRRAFAEVNPSVSPSPHSEIGRGETGDWTEDKSEEIDVIGANSPLPEPVIISWSGGENTDEDGDVDVVGGITDYTLSNDYAAVELVDRKYPAEVFHN